MTGRSAIETSHGPDRRHALGLALCLGLAACWTGEPPPPEAPALANTATTDDAAPPLRRRRGPLPEGARTARRPPPSLSPAQLQFPDELRAVRADAYACAQAHGVALTHMLTFEITADAAGAVTAAKVTGFGAAEPCVLRAIRARTFTRIAGSTVTMRIPWSSGHPAP